MDIKIPEDALLKGDGITISDLLESPVATRATIRSICILRRELLAAPRLEDEEQRLEARLTGLYHSLTSEVRNAAFDNRKEADS
jgi:hypothetical protein